MSSFKHSRVLSWPLTIRRGEAQLKATQVIVFDDPASHLVEFAALWTAKEALSKVLCTGLMSPVEIYNLSEFSRISSGN
jgi:phosphopantetheinyl transferase